MKISIAKFTRDLSSLKANFKKIVSAKNKNVSSAWNKDPQSTEVRVLVFDCWLPGFLYVRDLAGLEGVSLLFVHNSESQLGQPAQEYKDFKKNLAPPEWVKDFSEYKRSFRELYETFKPDVVLVTSMHYVEHRSALLFAKEYGICRAFIPHGIFYLNESGLPVVTATQGETKIGRLIKKIPRAIYYTNFFWRVHFERSAIKRGSFWQAVTCFKELLLTYSQWQWSPSSVVQAYYLDLLDAAIVYDDSLKNHYIEHSGSIFARAKFLISGTLDSGKLLREIKAKPTLITREQNSRPVAYYISSPYPEFFSENGARILADLLKQLEYVIKSAGCSHLIYRAHPGEPTWFVDLLSEFSGIERDTAPGTEGMITADLICGTSSSLLYNAVLLAKNIVIVESNKIKMDAPYYEPLISYPKITLNLDLDKETLVEAYGDALRAKIAKRSTLHHSNALDPLGTLLEFYKDNRV